MVELKQTMKMIYFRVFYCIFNGLKRSYREDDKTTTIISSIHLAILMYWNVFALSLFATAVTGIKIYQYPWHWLLLLFSCLNCFFFLRKKKYLQIKALFDQENEKDKTKRKTMCIIYIILSCVAFPLALYLVGSMGLYGYVP